MIFKEQIVLQKFKKGLKMILAYNLKDVFENI